MKKISKILSIILAVMMVISIVPITASAATYTGTCGENLTWTYDSSTYTLSISGTGDMYDYKSNNRPWESYEDKIKNVFIDNGITKIGNYAFYSCENIINIELPNTVIVIGNSAFCSCKKLSTITIPYGVTTIEYRAFGSCISLTNVTMPNSITTIRQNAFISCTSLTNITIPDSVVTIEKTAFVHCENLLSIIVDENNQYYSNDKYGVLFNKDKTTLIYYPGGCIKTNYTVPEGTLTIGDSAFVYAYKLISVTFANSVIRIGKYAFDGCDKLTTVIIPDSVTEIGYSAFVEWSHEPSGNLTDVYYTGTEEQWKSISIDDYNDRLINATIHYNYHIHKYNSVVTEPTCTEQGYTTHTCTCGDSYVDDYVDETGHNYDSVVTPPTCTEQGYTTYTCECGDSYIDDYVTETGHSYDSVITPPTCTEQGYTTYTCECGDSYIDNYVDATGHTYGEWTVTKEATVDAEGEMKRVCSCGEKEYKSIDKLPVIEDDNNSKQKDTSKEDIKNPEIPDTNAETTNIYFVFMLMSFVFVVEIVVLSQEKRYYE